MACPVLISPACVVAGKVVGRGGGHRRVGRAQRDRRRDRVRDHLDGDPDLHLVGAAPVPGPVRRARRGPAPAVDAAADRRGRRARADHRGREDGADPPREPAHRCRLRAGRHRRDLGRGRPAALAADQGGRCLVHVGAPGVHRGPVHPAAGQRADPGRVDPVGGRRARHRRHHHLRRPGGAHAVPARRPGRPGRGAAAGRRRDADPGHPPLVPPRHRLDARADLLQAGRGGGVRDRVHHDRHRQGPAHRADGLHDGVPVPAGAAGPDAVLHLDHRARRGRLRRRRLPPDRAPGSRGRRRAARDVRRSGRLRPGRAGPHGQRPARPRRFRAGRGVVVRRRSPAGARRRRARGHAGHCPCWRCRS